MTKKRPINPIWAIALIANIALIIILYLTRDFIGIEKFSNYVGLPLYAITPGILVILGIFALFQTNKIKEISKWSLFFLVLGFALNFLAEQTWNLYEYVLDIDPFPSFADIFYVGAVGSIFTSLIIFLKPRKHKIPTKNILFAITISSIVLIPSIVITYDYAIEDNFVEIFVAILYPIIDSILLIPAIIAIMFTIKSEKNFFWLMILAGIIVFLVADTIFLYTIIDDTYYGGHPVDILWISSYTIWAFMMFHILHNAKKNTLVTIPQQYEDYKVGIFQKFGMLSTLVLINVIIGIILVSMNLFFDISQSDTILSYFSWILMLIVIIFSSIIISLNSKLNITLQSRTTKLEKVSEDLIKAEKLSVIGKTASRIAHDLRNPLSIISNEIELIKLQDLNPNEKIQKSTNKINRAIQRMTHQLKDVMDFVRTKPLDVQNQSMRNLIISSINSLPISSEIKINLPENDCMLSVDPIQMETVFNNLIYNSVQAIGNSGEIDIRIFDNLENAIIEFQDSGSGILEKNLETIFEPLFTTKETGTGLGLVSCRTIVTQHGGTISVTSLPTIFTITLPKNQ